MKILKLSQQATVSRPVDSIIGWEEKTIYETVFVVAEHIESFLFAGVSHIKMTSGEKIVVRETPEEILALLGVDVQTDSLKTWDEIAQKGGRPMSNIDKQTLREAANAANSASWGNWESYKPHKEARGYEVKAGVKAVAQHCLKVDSVFIAAANPATVLALLDELEAKDKENAKLRSVIKASRKYVDLLEMKMGVGGGND